MTVSHKNTAFVYSYNTTSQSVSKMPVSIGNIFGSSVAIVSGISEGTQIVTKGANFLSDKSKVKVIK